MSDDGIAWPFDEGKYSEKINGPGVKCTSIVSHDIVLISTQDAASVPEPQIFKNELDHMMFEGEVIEANMAARRKIQLKNPQTSK